MLSILWRRCVLCCLVVLFAGCASSGLVDVWSDSYFQNPSLARILVISVGKNAVQRRLWEDAFSIGLAAHDVAATPSYRLFPDAVPDTGQVLQIVRSRGFDGVLLTRRLLSKARTESLQGYATQRQDIRYERRQDRFAAYYRNIERAGFTDPQKADIRAIDVWATTNDGHMMWSATSKAPEPNSVQPSRPEIVKLVVLALSRQGIIAFERQDATRP